MTLFGSFETMTYFGKSKVLATFPALFLVACGGDTAPAGSDEGGADEAAQEISVDFMEVDASTAEGAVRLTLEGDTYSALVSIDTHRGPGEYPIDIHSGTCAEIGGPLVVEVVAVEGQEGGEGQARGSFARSQLPAGGQYYIDIHDAQDGSVLACADLPEL